jgi:hypothetical protein
VKSVKNFRYVEKTSAECNEDSYLAILHLSRVELHCKLQEKLPPCNMAFSQFMHVDSTAHPNGQSIYHDDMKLGYLTEY